MLWKKCRRTMLKSEAGIGAGAVSTEVEMVSISTCFPIE
jgi:hypothetical protein